MSPIEQNVQVDDVSHWLGDKLGMQKIYKSICMRGFRKRKCELNSLFKLTQDFFHSYFYNIK